MGEISSGDKSGFFMHLKYLQFNYNCDYSTNSKMPIYKQIS